MSTSPCSFSRKSNEERAKRIEQYYIRHDKDKKKTYLHFMDEGLTKKTIYHILRRHDQRGDVTFKKPTGRRVSVCTPEMFAKLADLFKNNPELSCREAAKKLGIARTTIFRVMAKMREKNLETYKVIDSEPRCPTCHQKIDPKHKLAIQNTNNATNSSSSSGNNNSATAKKKKKPVKKRSDNNNANESNMMDNSTTSSQNMNYKDDDPNGFMI